MPPSARAFRFRWAGAQGNVCQFQVILDARSVLHEVERNQAWSGISRFRS